MNESFIFFISFLEAIEDLPDKDRLKCYDLICNYALRGTLPDKLSGITKTVFALVKPNIDSNIKKRKGGSKGGRPPKDEIEKGENEKPMVSKTKNHRLSKQKTIGYENGKTNVDVDVDGDVDVNVDVNADGDVEADVDVDADTPPLNPPKGKRETQEQIFDRLIVDQNIGPAMEEKIREWLKYKAEKRDGYKEQGMKSLLGKIMKAVYEHGETAVMDAIDTSMASGWRGLFFDRIPARGQPRDRMQQTTDMIDRWEIAREEYERRNNDTS